MKGASFLCYAVIGVIVEFLIKANDVDDELRFAIKGGGDKKIEKKAMNTEKMSQKLSGSGDNINFHVRDEMVSHVVFPNSVRDNGKTGAHKIENEAIGNKGKNGEKMARLEKKNNEGENSGKSGKGSRNFEAPQFFAQHDKTDKNQNIADDIKDVIGFFPEEIDRE